MSESDGGAGQREVAYRVFAAEYDDADLDYSEGEDERSPNYVITPTGARVNRLFVVGVLTEVEEVSEDVLRARVVDPTGAFVLYAGQYQPDEQAFLERAEPPMFVAVTGKARTFSPEDTDRVYTSVRPESLNEVDAETRDRWTVQAAEETLYRVQHAARALSMDERGDTLAAALDESGVEEGLAAGIPLAIDHYGTTPTYLGGVRKLALDAARVVAGEREEVGELDVSPDEAGAVTVMDLVEQLQDVRTVPASVADETDPATAQTDGTDVSADTSQPAPTESAASETEAETEETETATTSETETETIPETTANTGETTEDGTDDVADPGDFDPEEFELESETREQIKEEYGTEFQTGTEVDEPGEADIETPEPEEETTAEPEEETTAEPEEETTAESGEPARAEPVEADQTEERAEPVAGESEPATRADTADTETAEPDDEEPDDLVGAVVDVMGELDDGDGADRETLVETVTDRYGTPSEEVEEAVQQALMDGKCYEPDDTSVKPI